MVKHRAIPPKHDADIRRMVNEGKLNSEIHKYLSSEGVDCSYATVTRAVQRFKAEYAKATSNVLAAEAQKTVVSDMELINRNVNQLQAAADIAFSNGKMSEYKMLASELKHWIGMRLDLAKGTEADVVMDDDATEEWMNRLELVAKGRDAKEKN